MESRERIIEMVQDFLELTSSRELDQAAAYLADGATMVFPGGYRFTSLTEMAEQAKKRYRWVRKRMERWDVFPAQESGVTTVYCLGTLYGEDLNGQPFEGVRFVDRFEIENGRIRLQEVWNDLGQRMLSGD